MHNRDTALSWQRERKKKTGDGEKKEKKERVRRRRILFFTHYCSVAIATAASLGCQGTAS